MADAKSIKVSYGKINLTRSCGTLASFKVVAPFVRTSAANSGKSDPGKRQYVNATAHRDIGGGFTSADVIHEESTVIMVQGSRTRGGMRVADACLFLRLRTNAAFIVIKFKLPTGPESIMGDNHIAFSGCADFMNIEQLRALGIEVSNSFSKNYMAPEEVAELFETQVIRAETSPGPNFVRVATSQGVELKAMAAEPIRRIRLRRT